MESTTLVLMGRTGNGKSSTGNSIIGENVFKVGLSFKSVTKECQLEQTTWKDGRTINVIDTPGLFDTNSATPREFIQNQIVKCIDLAKGVVHGVLYVVSVNNRFTEEEASVLNSLELLFGPDIVNYIVVLFTGGDELEKNGMTLEEYLKDSTPQLEGVLRRCNMRKVLFNNKTTSQTEKEAQKTNLMKEIDNLIAQNGGRPFTYEPQDDKEKLFGRETCHTPSQTCFGGGQGNKYNVECIKQSNPTVGGTVAERTTNSDDERKKLQQDAQKLTEEIERSQRKNLQQKICEMILRMASSSQGCTIL